MTVSLGEVEATARKAARGAGHSWGMAEEAGQAARWLCARGLDGCGLLARALDHADTGGPGSCPLAAGTAAADGAGSLANTPGNLPAVVAPALVLPFAAAASRALGTPVSVAWDGLLAVCDGPDLSLSGDKAALTAPMADVVLRRGGTGTQALPRHSRAAPRPGDWAALTAYAQRIHAPDTDTSRTKGAGAGLSDND